MMGCAVEASTRPTPKEGISSPAGELGALHRGYGMSGRKKLFNYGDSVLNLIRLAGAYELTSTGLYL
jgi:hypothetical protein